MNLKERARLFLALDIPRDEKLDGYEGLVRELADDGQIGCHKVSGVLVRCGYESDGGPNRCGWCATGDNL